ncbi:hypothetical protein, partial [Xanthomonas campestris]|uniref:hypothetical protein n=1 Tax=Xanthomonas campestris TaxID=339 RepID=UPI001ED8C253
LRTAVITVAGCGKFGASPWHVVPALRSVQLASVASRAAASLGKLHLASCGKLDPGGSAGSMVAPSNLCGHSLPNNSFKPKLLRNSA